MMKTNTLLKLTKAFLCLSFFALFSIQTMAQNTGTLYGVIKDVDTGETLPGANVVIKGTSFGTSTDRNRRYTLRGIPAGEQVISITYLGFNPQEITVEVVAGSQTELNVDLEENFYELEGVRVQANLQGQARALNQQKTASNIKNVVAADLIGRFPDANAAEALRRVPAITVQRDQGAARYIQIRGTAPNLSNVSINGEQIPSPEGDVRFVAMDMIPSDVLSSIEVSKAITPDMDGDAIGGAVNLNTLSGVSGRTLRATFAGNYNDQPEDFSPFGGNFALAYGDRALDNKLGYFFSGSATRFNRASDNNEVEYDERDIDELQLRDYELTRDRYGLTSSLDYRFNPTSKVFVNGMFTYFSDNEVRRLLAVQTDVFAREFKDRFEEQKIFSLSGGGEHQVGTGFVVDYLVSYSYADQNTPKDREIIFEQEVEDVNGDAIDLVTFSNANPDYPQFNLTPEAQAAGAGAYNYGQFEFDEFSESTEITRDQNFTTRLNLKKFYTIGDEIAGELKFGGLYRTKTKETTPTVNIYGYDGDLLWSDVQSGFIDSDFLFNEYAQGIGLFPGADNIENFFNANRANFEFEDEDSRVDTESERFDATENTYAGYVMTELRKNKLSGIVGFRYEFTDIDYTARQVEFDANGDLLPITNTNGENDFGFFLPMVHLTYRASPLTNIRFAWTNTYARPNYFDLAPYTLINREDDEVELGNPGLDPTTSMNLDLMGEYYFSSVGVVSAGVFYKDIDNFIYQRQFQVAGAGPFSGFDAVQPVNGEDAFVLGFEFNLQQQLTFLPGVLDGLGIYANYTYTYSEADLFNSDGDLRTVTLPGQAENIGNFALSYEKFGFSGRVALAYAGSFVEELRDQAFDDRYYDEHLQLDVSASQFVTPNIQVFAEVNNLTNEPQRAFNGVSSRPEQQEFYSFWSTVGVKIRF
jgi:TonB-dependent receptor